MQVLVRLHGPLAWLVGRDELSLGLEEGASVLQALRALCRQVEGLEAIIFDPDTGDPRTNFLILLNGRDVDVLGGLSARLSNGDRLELLPLIRL